MPLTSIILGKKRRHTPNTWREFHHAGMQAVHGATILPIGQRTLPAQVQNRDQDMVLHHNHQGGAQKGSTVSHPAPSWIVPIWKQDLVENNSTQVAMCRPSPSRRSWGRWSVKQLQILIQKLVARTSLAKEDHICLGIARWPRITRPRSAHRLPRLLRVKFECMKASKMTRS